MQRIELSCSPSKNKGLSLEAISPKGNYAIYFLCSNYLKEKELLWPTRDDAGLHIPTAVTQGILLVDSNVVLKSVGVLSAHDLEELHTSVKQWLGL